MTSSAKTSEEIESELENALDKYFSSLGSTKMACSKCSRVYYTFQKDSFCGSSKCLTPIPFSEKINSNPTKTSHIYLGEKFCEFFNKLGYALLPGQNIQDSSTTLFIGAGIQAIDGLFAKDTLPSNPFYLVQPCVRIHATGVEKTQKGCSSSFHVASTQRINSTIDEFIIDVDDWLKYLANIKFPYSRMNFFFGKDWTGGEMKGATVAAYLGKTQLCDFVYVHKMPEGARIKTIADMSLGLERLSWIKTQTPRYFESFCSIKYLRDFRDEQLDLIRTMTLLASSGVHVSNKSRGYKVEQGLVTVKRGSGQILRQLAKLYAEGKGSSRINDVVQNFYEEWSKFGKITIPLNDVQKIVREEINREYNLQIIKHFNLDPKKFQIELGLDDFAHQLSQKAQIPFNKVVEALKNGNLLH